MNKFGFTLVELLVVITIISILSTIGMVMYRSAQDSAKLAKTQSQMRELRTMMEQFRLRFGELPPIGDACTSPSCLGAESQWNLVLDALVTNGMMEGTQRSNYLTDAWGSTFMYDDNDKACCGSFSLFWTRGANKITDRDVMVFSEGKNCGGDDWCLDFPYGQ